LQASQAQTREYFESLFCKLISNAHGSFIAVQTPGPYWALRITVTVIRAYMHGIERSENQMLALEK
jgi:hypothetical protein